MSSPSSEQKLYIDNSELRSDIPRLLRDQFGLSTEVVDLAVGDYTVAELCIERKTVSDLLSSAQGRLWDQLAAMKENFQKPVLLIVGRTPPKLNKATMILRRRVLGIKAAVTLSFGIPIVMEEDELTAAEMIAELFIKVHKEGGLKPTKKKAKTAPDIREEILCCLPRVGRKQAKLLLSTYDFLDILTWKKEDWLQIKGIGEKAAGLIQEVFT